jgi:hypothetical protein
LRAGGDLPNLRRQCSFGYFGFAFNLDLLPAGVSVDAFFDYINGNPTINSGCGAPVCGDARFLPRPDYRRK